MTTTTDPGRRTRGHLGLGPVDAGLGVVRDPSPLPDGLRLRAALHDGVRAGDGGVRPVLPAVLADSGIGKLIFSAARLTAGAPTVDLRIDLAGPPAPGAGELVADITLLHLDDEIGAGRAEIRDDTGVLVAHAVATMALSGVPDRPGGLAGPESAKPGDGAADFRAGIPPFDPARLEPDRLGTDDGDPVLTPGPSTMNLNGTTHGAVLAGFAQSAQAFHLRRSGPGPARPLSLTVDYLRPVPVGAPLRARSETVRDGRRFWTVHTELLLADGRLAARAVGGGLRALR
ncbi:thioesterase family protein [Pseudonocardia sp. C8]|uniref:PaaI family thioesterase n=1 Tax=Pseudonocardia sp. C8 TaxID=2762759 RepID=UPI0016427B6B|nr:acyl-CoA thioesterase domain-containing protein [Pseudonocardia sp. C8]MBC3191261.1 thioesterase family protein [Pseudonocardia sp. C8]